MVPPIVLAEDMERLPPWIPACAGMTDDYHADWLKC
jgi:hypothetical protein